MTTSHEVRAGVSAIRDGQEPKKLDRKTLWGRREFELYLEALKASGSEAREVHAAAALIEHILGSKGALKGFDKLAEAVNEKNKALKKQRVAAEKKRKEREAAKAEADREAVGEVPEGEEASKLPDLEAGVLFN